MPPGAKTKERRTEMKTMREITDWTAWTHRLRLAIVVLFVTGAVAQTHYSVQDLGTLKGGNFACAMGLNNKGWTEVMDTLLEEKSGNMLLRASLRIDGVKIDLGTLGGPNSWINWGGINQRASAVGFAETPTPDPNGEDFCFFGTKLTCRPFLWHDGDMAALPTLGGNNGQASAINSRGRIVGQAETSSVDSGCPPNRIALPVLWQKGLAEQLPTVEGDPDGYALGINDLGQAVGATGTCNAGNHAVLWENGTAVKLPDLGNASYNEALAINNQGQIVGLSSSPDGSTFYAAFWQNGTITNLGTLPGDFAALATGINDKGQVVGSTLDSSFNWSHGFIWRNGVMTDLNTLIPADSNLYVTMANKINSHGQISGMATVLSGPHAGDIHAFLATPVNASIASSVAAVATTHPKSTLPANVRQQLLRGLGFGRFDR
jgi:probable HAF family extracellular repeat protein